MKKYFAIALAAVAMMSCNGNKNQRLLQSWKNRRTHS